MGWTRVPSRFLRGFRLVRPRPWVVGAGIVALGVALAILAFCGGRPEDVGADDWSYPELQPARMEPAASLTPAVQLAGKPRAVELLLEPRAVLVSPKRVLGPESLRLESRQGGRAAVSKIRFLAGRAAGRIDTCKGLTELTGLPAGAHLFEARGPGGRSAVRLVRLPRARPLVLEWSTSANVHGTVFGPDGQPLAGAEVVVGDRLTHTDAAGRFASAGQLGGEGLPLRIAASGAASLLAVVAASSEPSLRYVLGESFSVRGVLQVPPASRRQARVAVIPVGVATAFPFYWPGKYSDVVVDSRGRFRITGLPRSIPVALGVVHSTYVLEQPARLTPPASRRHGRFTRAYLAPRSCVPLRGRVLNETGQAMPAASLLGQRSGGRGTWGAGLFVGRAGALLPGFVAAFGGTMVRTSSAGRYELGLCARRTEVVVEAAGCLGRRLVLPRPRRPMLRDFTLEPATDRGVVEPARIVVHFQVSGSKMRPLRVQIRWSGTARDEAFLHDPRQPLELPALGNPGIIRVGLRVPGERAKPRMHELRVLGRTSVTLVVPQT